MSSTLQVAEDLTDTCFQMYNRTATRLAPEISHFVMRPKRDDVPAYARRPQETEEEQTDEGDTAGGRANAEGDRVGLGLGAARIPRPMGLVGGNGMDGDFIMKSNDAHNLLRPETVSVHCSSLRFCFATESVRVRVSECFTSVDVVSPCLCGLTSPRDCHRSSQRVDRIKAKRSLHVGGFWGQLLGRAKALRKQPFSERTESHPRHQEATRSHEAHSCE